MKGSGDTYVPITALPPVQQILGNMPDIGLDMAHQGDIIIPREGRIAGRPISIDVHFDLFDAALGDRPRPDKARKERLVLRHGVALADEPLHGVDLPAAIQAAPVLLVAQVGVGLVVVAHAPLGAVVLARLAVLHAHHGQLLGGALGEALHDGALHYG